MDCRPDSPLACPARRASMDAGEMSYVWGLGWIWWRAKNVLNPWAKCPFCASALPMMERIVADGVQTNWTETPDAD